MLPFARFVRLVSQVQPAVNAQSGTKVKIAQFAKTVTSFSQRLAIPALLSAMNAMSAATAQSVQLALWDTQETIVHSALSATTQAIRIPFSVVLVQTSALFATNAPMELSAVSVPSALPRQTVRNALSDTLEQAV